MARLMLRISSGFGFAVGIGLAPSLLDGQHHILVSFGIVAETDLPCRARLHLSCSDL